MLFDFTNADACIGNGLILSAPTRRWGVDSEYGRLRDVLLSAPPHLAMVPCNAVTRQSIGKGLTCCPDTAAKQHAKLVAALEAEGVTCHFVPPTETLPDLSFTRDAVLLTPWGMLELNPSARHRRAEVRHVRTAAEAAGVPLLGALSEGHLEGGDICLLRPGTVVIGYSGERSNKAGAVALSRFFKARGWQAILYCFDPHFLHLDTMFTMIDRNRALACVEILEESFIDRLNDLGIEIVPVSHDEVQRLGANLLSLGDGRLISSVDNIRVNRVLEGLGYRVVAVEIDQFVRCGGGIHCLTNPLSRLPG